MILTSSSKKFSPCGGPPSGRLLKRRAVSDDPLRGGFTVSIPVESTVMFSTIVITLYHNPENVSKFEYFFPFLDDLVPLYLIPTSPSL